VGSAVNDATRLLGGTLGVAVIGSVYASLYAGRLSARLPKRLPPPLAHAAHSSVGAALEVARGATLAGRHGLGAAIQDAATSAFIRGLSVGCLVAGGVAAAGAVAAAALLPAQPPRSEAELGDEPARLAPAGSALSE
jgi:hypothetical protein